MAVERDLEFLDDYLTNRLNGEQKVLFEKQLEEDPSLKNELKLQQKLIQGIKNSRAAELKLMLNNATIPPVSNTASLTKAASWIIITGIVGTGLYFLIDNKTKEEITKPLQPTINQEIAQNTNTNTTTIKAKDQTLVLKSDQTGNNQSIAGHVKKNDLKSAADSNTNIDVATSERKTVTRPKPEVFDPSSEVESNTSVPANADVRTETTSKKLVASSIEVETNGANKKYGFHYQFKSGKLFLYGSFEKNLYEIMEFFSGNKRTVFLFYKESYYLLNEDNEKIKPLVSISDPVMLQKLQEYRGDN